MRVDESASGSELRLRAGERLEVVLAETPTPGYFEISSSNLYGGARAVHCQCGVTLRVEAVTRAARAGLTAP